MKASDLFDDYLNGRLNETEKQNFEQQLKNNPVIAGALADHKKAIETLKHLHNRNQLKQQLNAIHQAEFGNDAKIISISRPTGFFERFGRTIMVAASTAVVAVVGLVAALSYSGYLLTNQSDDYQQLSKKVDIVKAQNEKLAERLNKPKKPVYAPANFEASAFAIHNAGYLVTSYHTIKGADSVFIRNGFVERTMAKVVLTNPQLDLALLKIEDAEVVKGWRVPFAIKKQAADVGEKVFTIGYPKKDMVYGEGSLSSMSGHANDTNLYQMSIPVNPGNSGGPLLDEQGNIIGLVCSKEVKTEGTGFALKSGEILRYLESAPDSVKKEILALGKYKNQVKNLKRTEQIKRINPYVFNVLVYK